MVVASVVAVASAASVVVVAASWSSPWPLPWSVPLLSFGLSGLWRIAPEDKANRQDRKKRGRIKRTKTKPNQRTRRNATDTTPIHGKR